MSASNRLERRTRDAVRWSWLVWATAVSRQQTGWWHTVHRLSSYSRTLTAVCIVAKSHHGYRTAFILMCSVQYVRMSCRGCMRVSVSRSVSGLRLLSGSSHLCPGGGVDFECCASALWGWGREHRPCVSLAYREYQYSFHFFERAERSFSRFHSFGFATVSLFVESIALLRMHRTDTSDLPPRRCA